VFDAADQQPGKFRITTGSTKWGATGSFITRISETTQSIAVASVSRAGLFRGGLYKCAECGGEMVSVILCGSAARGGFSAIVSDLNLMPGSDLID
jgi:hypothetical protein